MSSLLAASTRAPRSILATELCLPFTQIRMASRSRPAPHLRRGKPIVWTPQERAMFDDMDKTRLESREEFKAGLEKTRTERGEMTLLEKINMCRTTAVAAEEISTKQAMFLGSWYSRCERDPSASPSLGYVRDLLGHLDPLSLDDVYDLTFILRNKGTVACAKTGRRLINTCAELGHAEAAIQVVASALRQDATKPGVMRNPTVMKALDRLREVAKTGNVRALVMEANVARHLNQVGRAIRLYRSAVDRMMEDDGQEAGDKYSLIKDELSSPWIELAYLHHTQGEMVAAMKAYLAGQEKDDPMAFFNLARLDLFMAGHHSHDWLYNMTKAAASGHYLAAQELGEYYANSAAKPAEPQSFMDKLSGFVDFLYKPNVNLNPKTNIHHHDAFAKTSEQRIKLAREWLLTASSNYYLFANISLAQLYLQKFIYPEGTLKKPLDPYGHSTEPDAIDNPIFNPERAQVMLTEVLTACKVIAEAKSVSKTNAEYLQRARPWSFHGEVLEAVEGTEPLQELQEQAEMIADAAGIDIYSTKGLMTTTPRLGFIRAHKGTRGEGLCEHPSALVEAGQEIGKTS
ncbi:hypothetical protein E4T50_09281 [Aureobasidium sp. EXF-12298]|nr:hypothetical protein E4T50_09281 [Aureobasidium sp. EXF-12298]